MVCRLCMSEGNNYQKLEGAICDMLKAVLQKKCIDINNPVICSCCTTNVEKAFEFRNNCLRTQKLLSLSSDFNNKKLYIQDNKLCLSTKNNTSLKLCRICSYNVDFASNLLEKYDIINQIRIYVPEMVIDDQETSLICFKCSDHYRIFSEFMTVVNKTENMIANYCDENNITDTQQINLEKLLIDKNTASKEPDEVTNFIKLIDEKDHFLFELESRFLSLDDIDGTEDTKKTIIKKVIEEDVDLFYKEKPETFSEESGIDSDQGNIIFSTHSHQLLLSDCEEDLQSTRIRESFEEEPSVRLSFETEESSLSPGTLSDKCFYESESQDEGKKDDRGASSPNPFIFFSHYQQNEERCSCDEGEVSQQTSKRKWCEKCQWKNSPNCTYESEDSNGNNDELVMKKRKKDGKKKCRKAFGVESKDLWCKQCRWKKACTRFGNAKAVNRR